MAVHGSRALSVLLFSLLDLLENHLPAVILTLLCIEQVLHGVLSLGGSHARGTLHLEAREFAVVSRILVLALHASLAAFILRHRHRTRTLFLLDLSQEALCNNLWLHDRFITGSDARSTIESLNTLVHRKAILLFVDHTLTAIKQVIENGIELERDAPL